MDRIVVVLMCFVPLAIQSPLRELPVIENQFKGGTVIDAEYNEELVIDRDSAYFCPFSHPGYLDLEQNSTTVDIGIPSISDPNFVPVQSEETPSDNVERHDRLPRHDFERGYYWPFKTSYDLKSNGTATEFESQHKPDQESVLLRPKRAVQFKTKYVDHSGNVLSYSSGQPQIRVDATVHVSDYALTLAAETIKEMTRHMPAYIFNSCASYTKVGVFTKAESLTVFPEFAHLAAPAGCGSSCAGHCHSQCTFDGRPYSSLAGTGGRRGVIVEDNVLCNSHDPYRKKDNILVHEYAHTIKNYCLPHSMKSRITSAYNHAKSHGTWTNSQYAMATEEEYWAVGSEVWFNTLHTTYASAGMNLCSGQLCTSANAARWNLYHKDISLYGLLLEVYFNNNPNIVAGMKSCTTLH